MQSDSVLMLKYIARRAAQQRAVGNIGVAAALDALLSDLRAELHVVDV